jgi:hypothetical protein
MNYIRKNKYKLREHYYWLAATYFGYAAILENGFYNWAIMRRKAPKSKLGIKILMKILSVLHKRITKIQLRLDRHIKILEEYKAVNKELVDKPRSLGRVPFDANK